MDMFVAEDNCCDGILIKGTPVVANKSTMGPIWTVMNGIIIIIYYPHVEVVWRSTLEICIIKVRL